MLYLILAFFTGIILVVQMYINSQLSERLDSFNGVFYNYFSAVLIFILYFIFKPSSFVQGFSTLNKTSWWMFGGAFIGILVVAMCNYAYKTFSGTYTTSLIILGQLMLAIVIDRIFGITIELKEIMGIVLIASGIAYNSYINREKPEKPEKVEADGVLIK